MDFSQFSALRYPDGGLKIRHAAPLGAGLEDALGLSYRIVEGLAKPDCQTAGLFAVDILAGLGCKDRRWCVPAVAGADHHGVDISTGEQVAEVAVEDAIFVAVMLIDKFLTGFTPAGLNVADGHAANIGLWQHAT